MLLPITYQEIKLSKSYNYPLLPLGNHLIHRLYALITFLLRRLCILKGIYPREPSNKKKVGGGSTAPKTYYYRKDIQYLLHEPLVQKFRDYKIYARKLKKAVLKKDYAHAKALKDFNRPVFTLDHIIKER